jgi:hypothetical protein
MALQLRYLQTLTEIGTEKNTTIVFPLPIDLVSTFQKLLEKKTCESMRRRIRGSAPYPQFYVHAL